MSRIIYGHFDHIEQVQAALEEFSRRGFSKDEYTSYYLNPPGQQGLFLIRDQVSSDAGAKDATKGAAAGAAIGGAAGLAIGTTVAGPVGAIAGAGVGAYVGSLAGALKTSHSASKEEATAEHPVAEHPGGPMIAVCADRAGVENEAISVLRKHGAQEIAGAEGEWVQGNWQDYDPRIHSDPIVKASNLAETPKPEEKKS